MLRPVVMCSIALTLCNIAFAQLSNKLRGYWPLDNGPVELFHGLHGRADPTSYPLIVQGVVGRAIQFDGKDDYFRLGGTATVNTIYFHAASFWIKAEESIGFPLFSAADGWFVQYLPGGFLLGPGQLRPQVPLFDVKNTWYHVFVQDSPSHGEMYINGKKINPIGRPPNSDTVSSAGISPTFFFLGGSPVHGSLFRGSLDELIMWDRSLSSTEIMQIYVAGSKGLPFSSLLLDANKNALPDIWEETQGLSNVNSADDPDRDGMSNFHEFLNGLNPLEADSDHDEIVDGIETCSAVFGGAQDPGTCPYVSDTDYDGLMDGAEIFETSTNPLLWDTDADGYSDGDEEHRSSDPLNPNSKPDLGVGLKAYWAFDGDLNDQVGGFHGIFRSKTFEPDRVSPAFVQGINGNALELRAEAIDIPSRKEEFAFANRDFSLSCWALLADFENDSQYFLITQGSGRRWHIATWTLDNAPGQRGWKFFVPPTGDPASTIDDGLVIGQNTHDRQWHHLVCVYSSPKGAYGLDSPAPTVYIDGSLAAWHDTRAGARATPASIRKFRHVPLDVGLQIGNLGGESATQFFGANGWRGLIDELAIWGRALTPSEARAIYLGAKVEHKSIRDLLSGDQDHDGVPDSWELLHGLDGAFANGLEDFDGDGLTNREEYALGTNPKAIDSDNDGLRDLVESDSGLWISAESTGTDPMKADTDGDTLLDGAENPGQLLGSNPNLSDTDADGLLDHVEFNTGSDPQDKASLPSLSSGLYAYWPLDGNLQDVTSARHNGGAVGTPLLYRNAKFDSGVVLNGINQAAEILGAESDFDFVDQDFAVSLWFRQDPHPLVCKDNAPPCFVNLGLISKSAAGAGLTAGISTSHLGFHGRYSLQKLLPDGILHHMVGVVDARKGLSSLYLDGELLRADAAHIRNTPAGLWIGTHPEAFSPDRPDTDVYFWAGLIDDVAIWKRPLAPKEVERLFKEGKSVGELASLPGNPTDPKQDTDGDGATDAAEQLAGTDPKNRADFLRVLSIERSADGIALRWSSVAGKRYVVEHRANLGSQAWNIVSGESIVGQENQSTWLDRDAQRGAILSGYYRVKVVP